MDGARAQRQLASRPDGAGAHGLGRGYVEHAARRGNPAYCWTVDEPADLERQRHVIQQHRYQALNAGHHGRHGRGELLCHHSLFTARPGSLPAPRPATVPAPAATAATAGFSRPPPTDRRTRLGRPVQVVGQRPHPRLILVGIGDEHIPPLHYSALPGPLATSRRRHQRRGRAHFVAMPHGGVPHDRPTSDGSEWRSDSPCQPFGQGRARTMRSASLTARSVAGVSEPSRTSSSSR